MNAGDAGERTGSKYAGTLEVTLVSEQAVAIRRTFAAPRARVFAAFTEPALVLRWLWGPDEWRITRCEIDLRVGGALRYEWSNAEGTVMGMSGVYREIDPPARLVHTELFDEDWTGGETLVTTEFAEADGETTVTITVRYASQAARDAALKTGMADGMTQSYDRLAALLAEAA